MRNYQPKKNNNYKLDKNLFSRMVYLVKDYNRMKTRINELSSDLSRAEGMGATGQHSDPTLCKAMKIERMSGECNAVDWALTQIPEEFRTIIFNKILFDRAYPLHADLSTFSRWKCRFLYCLAEKLDYI